MIACVADIMKKNIQSIDFYDGLRKAESMLVESNVDCLPVVKHGVIAGILSLKDILKSHPNRIAADAMDKNIVSIPSKTSLWRAKQILEKNKLERLPVVDDHELIGFITRTELLIELGKYTDLLTGLYRSDYIYHQGVELLANGCEVSVIFLDLNKFGVIDKEYGHTQGDIILKELGMLLKDNAPSDTYLCRFGGDEFVLLTPYKLDKCRLLAENLIKAIETHIFSNQLTITAAVGISGGRRLEERRIVEVDTVIDLINLASLASTKAKKDKQGVVVAQGFCNHEESATA